MLRLSIIVPVYNVAPYLQKCVDSLLAQDIEGSEYEIILVDDGSTDGSGELCDNLKKKNAERNNIQASVPIVHVIHQANQGAAVARNHGVLAAKGEYVSFLDADDWWTRDFASSMLHLAKEYPQAGLYACKYFYVKNGKNEERVKNLYWIEKNTDGVSTIGLVDYFRSYSPKNAMPISSDTVLFRKQVFMELGGFREGLKIGEDFMLWVKAAMTYPVAYLDRCLAYYNNDIPSSARVTRSLHKPEDVMWFHLSELEQLPILSGINKEYIKNFFDKIRVAGLKRYWLLPEYTQLASLELNKVDWSKQPLSRRAYFSLPVGLCRRANKIKKFVYRRYKSVVCYYAKK